MVVFCDFRLFGGIEHSVQCLDLVCAYDNNNDNDDDNDNDDMTNYFTPCACAWGINHFKCNGKLGWWSKVHKQGY